MENDAEPKVLRWFCRAVDSTTPSHAGSIVLTTNVVRDETNGEVVGTYRILTPESASRIGYYSETEFDLARLDHLRPQLVEIGRSCVHPGHRSGATITLLWAGLGQFMKELGYEYLIGCASVSMADGGHLAASLYSSLSGGAQSRMAPEEY